MLWLLVCLTAAGALGVGAAMAAGRRSRRSLGEGAGSTPVLALPEGWDPPRSGGLVDELWLLKPDDVLEHMGQDICVADVRRFTGGGHHLLLARSVDEPDAAILVFDAPEPVASLVRRARGHSVTPNPPENLAHAGFRFRRVRRTELRAAPGPEQVVLHFYEGPDGVHLWVLARDGGLDVYDGRILRDGAGMLLRS